MKSRNKTAWALTKKFSRIVLPREAAFQNIKYIYQSCIHMYTGTKDLIWLVTSAEPWGSMLVAPASPSSHQLRTTGHLYWRQQLFELNEPWKTPWQGLTGFQGVNEVAHQEVLCEYVPPFPWPPVWPRSSVRVADVLGLLEVPTYGQRNGIRNVRVNESGWIPARTERTSSVGGLRLVWVSQAFHWTRWHGVGWARSESRKIAPGSRLPLAT